jgi:hypothetical protein
VTGTPLDRLRSKQPRKIRVGVFLDEDPADRLDAAVLALQEARQVYAPSPVPDGDLGPLASAVAAAQEALDAVTFWFTFKGIGRTRFNALLAEHPPTDADLAKAADRLQDRPEWCPATFTPALIAASCATPQMTLADVQALFDDEAWNIQELGALFAAALAVNTRARVIIQDQK